MSLEKLHRLLERITGRTERIGGVAQCWHYRGGRHVALHLTAKVDLFRFGTVTVALDHLGRLASAQYESALAAILGAPDAAPVGATVFAEQVIVDD